jgi:hypothetical protein
MPNGIVVAADLVCPECGAPMMLRYSRRYERPFYGCSRYERTKCPGTHGAHPNGEPLGIPADCATKAARHELHLVFDQLWKAGIMSRTRRTAGSSARSMRARGVRRISPASRSRSVSTCSGSSATNFPALQPIQEVMHG